MTYEALVWAWALALVLLGGTGWLLSGLITRLVNHALVQVKTLTDTGAGPPPPKR